MNHCPHCGKALEGACSFCPHCGKALSAHSTPKKKLPLKAVICVLALLGILAGALALPKLFNKSFSQNTRAIAEASASVVTIYTYDVNNVPIASGSGFAAIDEGIILTNYHVIKGETHRVEALTESGMVMEADSVIAYDADKDIAILRFYDCTLPRLSTADGMDLARGEPLTAIGSPQGLSNMVSTGVFSSYKQFGDHTIQMFTTSISNGSSGGALFNDDGNVVGITSGGYEGGNEIYYAVPFVYAKELYDNRDPYAEITPAKLWEQSEHTYTVDYVLAYPRQLSGKTIELKGFVSAVYHDLYIQASSEMPIIRRPVSELNDEEKVLLRELIREQLTAGTILMCQRESRGSFPDDLTDKYVTLRGKVMVYGENTSGDDVRFIVSEVIASE